MDKYEGRGILFPNKKTSEKQPDYKGKLNYNGKVIKLAAWINDDRISLLVDTYVPKED